MLYLPKFSHSQAIRKLVSWGCNREQIIAGSIPLLTLHRLGKVLFGKGLQVGGFVGIAHCFLAALPQVTSMFTIDPNIPHRGINKPLDKMTQLVELFDLQDKSKLITGYALQEMPKFGIEFDFILLDGNHDRANVNEEILMADKILKPEGLLVLDDIDNWEGPRSLYYENFPLKNYTKVPLDGRAGVLKKVS